MQAAMFCNQKPQAEWLVCRLSAAGYPATYIATRFHSFKLDLSMLTLLG